ncbi:MAG: hypothetical protein AB4352_23730 [Hormoscilla sp.]
MTRTPHDSFAKDLLEAILKPLGSFQAPLEVRDEARQIDAWFVPADSSASERAKLGLLGAIASTECLLEPVHAQLSPMEIHKCMGRQYILFALREREARREKRTLTQDDFPFLWILGTTVSAEITSDLYSKKGWPEGVYFSSKVFKVAIVAINQLPVNPETLWLRMLGKGSVQRRAFDEVKGLPSEESFGKKILDVVQKWYTALQGKQPKSEDEQELIMEIAATYEEWEQATLQRGIERGLERGLERGRVENQRQFIENFLIARFGAIDETLAATIEPLLKLSMAEVTSLMLELSSLEKEEFLARLQSDPELQVADDENSNPSS